MIEKVGKASISELRPLDHEELLRDIKYQQGVILKALQSNEPSKLNQVLVDQIRVHEQLH